MAKPWAKAFYNSKAWQRARELTLIRDGGLCTICGGVATEVDHIIPLTARNVRNPEISLNQENLRAICSTCHKLRHDEDRREGAAAARSNGCYFDENGYLIKTDRNIDSPR